MNDFMSGEIQKTKVGLVQINNSFSGQNYFPYSVGILQAYAQTHVKNVERYEFLLPVYLRTDVEDTTRKLEGSKIIFFSSYVWNIRMSLAIAEKIKRNKPETIIIFGGPQVPDRIEGFLQKYPFIDVACHGEGEQVFSKLLEWGVEGMRKKDFGDIPSISYLNNNGQVVTHARIQRIKDIEEIPSPYLSGIFMPLIKANPQEKWIVMWETNRGCPFSCAFCDWGSATQSRVYQFGLERIYKEIEWFANHNIEFIFCADANFGMLPRDYDIISCLVETKKKYGYPRALSIQNTKNATERAYKVQKLLSDSGLNKGVTISFQSVDPTTLDYIKRDNISTESYQELQRRFTQDGVETYSDIILGLPGETYESFCNGVASIIENGQHNRIQFNNLSILPNAAMGDPEYQKEHGMITVESKIVNVHGSLEAVHNEIFEMQELVIATKTCPKEDWIKVRVFSWMVNLFYFNKTLQIPLLLLHKNFNINIRDLFNIFTDRDFCDYPTLQEIQTFLQDKAKDIQEGGAEYCPSEKWLNIWWPADELILIRLCTENKLGEFYKEVEAVFNHYLKENYIEVPPRLFHEAVELNKALVKLPLQTEDREFKTSYNIWEVYQAARIGESLPIEEKQCHYHIDRASKTWSSWENWCEEVIWYGNKKGAYLYGNMPIDSQLAGHF